MAGSDPQPKKATPPRPAINPPRKPLQVMHISRKTEEEIINKEPSEKEISDQSKDKRFNEKVLAEKEISNEKIKWAFLPYSMHMAGPREALQHMIIRRNYGCTHFIIGRDMAGCKSSLSGEDFYGPYDAQDFAKKCCEELGMQTVPSLNLVFTEEEGYVTADYAQEKELHIKKLSGTQFRKMLRSGEEIPEWFAFKSVVDVLRAA